MTAAERCPTCKSSDPMRRYRQGMCTDPWHPADAPSLPRIGECTHTWVKVGSEVRCARCDEPQPRASAEDSGRMTAPFTRPVGRADG